MANEYRWSRREVLHAGAALAAGIAACPIIAGADATHREREGARLSAVVIGAGIGGLTAAYELHKLGIAVTVLEAASYHGGRMAERQTGPLFGPTHASGYFASNAEMIALAKELGVADSLAGSEIVLPADNGVGVYPFSLRFDAAEAARIPGMPDVARRALPGLGRAIRDQFGGVDPCLPLVPDELDAFSIAEFVRREAGSEAARPILDYAIGAVTTGWGVPVDEAACAPFLSIFAQDGGRYIRPNDSIATLPNALARQLDVRTNCAVTNVGRPRADGRRRISFLGPSGQPESVVPDLVICALPATRVLSVIDDLPIEARNAYADASFAKFAKVSYLLKADAPVANSSGAYYIPSHPDALKRRVEMWAVVPAVAHRPPVAMVALSMEEIRRWQDSGQALPEHAFPLLQAVCPWLDRSIVDDAVVNGGDYVPAMRVGFSSRARRLMDAQTRSPTRLYFVGENVSSAHVGGSCASARHVVRAIARHWQRRAATSS